MGSTAIPGGSAISSRGQTSFFAMAVKECFAFEKGCKWPKQRHFIDADILPHLFCVYNSLYFGVQKAKNGDRGTIVFTATLSLWQSTEAVLGCHIGVTLMTYYSKIKQWVVNWLIRQFRTGVFYFIFLSSRPRTGLATTYITGYGWGPIG